MKFYPKKISSLQQLKREQAKLKKKIKAEGKQFKKSAKDAPVTSGNAIIDVIGELLSPKSSDKGGLSLGLPLVQLAATQLQKGFLKKVAFEFVGGYLKWKAVELSYKTARKIIKSQKEKARLKRNR